jgi:hypothetical protein
LYGSLTQFRRWNFFKSEFSDDWLWSEFTSDKGDRPPSRVRGAGDGTWRFRERSNCAWLVPSPEICVTQTSAANAHGSFWQILLQKSFAFSVNRDSVALMGFAKEAVDDGAAQSRPRAIFLFIPS